MVQAVEESETQGAGGCADYLNRLQRIYKDILTASKEGSYSAVMHRSALLEIITRWHHELLNPVFSEQTELDQSSVFNTAMPYPEINFHLWRDKEDLCEANKQYILLSLNKKSQMLQYTCRLNMYCLQKGICWQTLQRAAPLNQMLLMKSRRTSGTQFGLWTVG